MMQKVKFILLLFIFIGCSSDDEETTQETVFNPHDQNSAKIDYDGLQIPNDSIPSIFVSTSFCCENIISVDLRIFQPPEFSGDVMKIHFSKEGEILNYFSYNDFLGSGTSYRSPYFLIPEEFVEIENFDFNYEEEKLNFKGKFKLIESYTYFDEGKVIDVDADVEVSYFTPCDCSATGEISKARQVVLTPEIQFSNFSMTIKNSFPPKYGYSSTNTSNGYYFKLGNLTNHIKDYPLGTYDIGNDETTLNLIFKKFIGSPHAFTDNHFIEDEWIDYEIQGQFEIKEKLDNNLTRSKLTFTASLNGEVVYVFTDVEMIL